MNGRFCREENQAVKCSLTRLPFIAAWISSWMLQRFVTINQYYICNTTGNPATYLQKEGRLSE